MAQPLDVTYPKTVTLILPQEADPGLLGLTYPLTLGTLISAIFLLCLIKSRLHCSSSALYSTSSS